MFNRLIAVAAKARLRPEVAVIRGEELAEGLNEDAYAAELDEARGAIVTELASQGLAAPDAILASGGYRLQAAGAGLVAVGVKTHAGAAGVLAAKDVQGNTLAAGGIKLADGASFGKWVVEGANGDAVLEHAIVNKRTKTLTYQVTAVIGGRLVSASATIRL